MREFIPQIIATLILILVMPLCKLIILKIVRKYGTLSRKLESRIRHITKVISILINLSAIIMIIVIWGVDPRNIFIAFSSIFAVIGVAFFAQWSLLSNVTAGILIFFTTPLLIGDYIRIHDKDIPIDAEIIDILTFNIHLRTLEGEIIIYPNSLFMQKAVSIISKEEFSQKKETEK